MENYSDPSSLGVSPGLPGAGPNGGTVAEGSDRLSAAPNVPDAAEQKPAMFPVEPSTIATGLWRVNMDTYDMPGLTLPDKITAQMVSLAMARLVRAIHSDNDINI